jgi:hypothetical protein
MDGRKNLPSVHIGYLTDKIFANGGTDYASEGYAAQER